MFDEHPTSATANVVDGENSFFHFVPVQISNDDKNDVDVCMHVALYNVTSQETLKIVVRQRHVASL